MASYKQELVLKPKQHHLIVGLLLGDGSMRCPGRSHHANLTVEHGAAQKEYVWWKYERFKEWVLTPPNEIRRIYHKDSNRMLVSWRFSTITHAAFTNYYKLFYRDCLWETFRIDSTLNFHSHSQGHRLYRIRLTPKGAQRACKIIMPYVLPSLMYKFSAIPL